MSNNTQSSKKTFGLREVTVTITRVKDETGEIILVRPDNETSMLRSAYTDPAEAAVEFGTCVANTIRRMKDNDVKWLTLKCYWN